MSRTMRSIQPSSEPARAEAPLMTTAAIESSVPTVEARNDDLSREVYGVLGIPIDAIDFPTLLHLMGRC